MTEEEIEIEMRDDAIGKAVGEALRLLDIDFFGVAPEDTPWGNVKEIYLPGPQHAERESILKMKRVISACEYLASHAHGSEMYMLLKMAEECRLELTGLFVRARVDQRLAEANQRAREGLLEAIMGAEEKPKETLH